MSTGPVEVTFAHPALAGRTGRGVRVAVIDSGVHAGHPHVGGLAGAVGLDDRGRPTDDVVDRLGHGTAVASAIHEKAPGAEIHVVKVFDRTLSTTIVALRKALAWSAENRMRLVNLSLGTPKEEHAPLLEESLAPAREAGCIVVSAREHEGIAWYPGSLPGAVGVELDWSLDRDALVLARATHGGVVARASGYPRPIPGVPPERNLKGVSFAVANVTGLLARALEGREEVTPGALAELLGLDGAAVQG